MPAKMANDILVDGRRIPAYCRSGVEGTAGTFWDFGSISGSEFPDFCSIVATGATKRYPCRGTVSIKTGLSDESPRV
jgi:hypothetical protein